MKSLLLSGLFVVALLRPFGAAAQETDNINNRFGPPNYTGGLAPTPSERFAYAQVAYRQEYSLNAIETAYPNPTRANVAVVLAQTTSTPVDIYIVNLNGVIQKTYTYAAGNRSYGIDMGDLTSGLYSIQVQERGRAMQRINVLKQD